MKMNKEICICDYVVGGCNYCPFGNECSPHFETVKGWEKWTDIISSLIYDLQGMLDDIHNDLEKDEENS